MSQKAEMKALRAPDLFQRAGGEVRDWIIARGTALAAGVGVVLVLTTAALIWKAFNDRNEESAVFELGEALRPLGRPVGAATETHAAPGEPPPFLDQRAKDQEIESTLSGFRARRLGTHSSVVAGLPLAQAMLRMNKPAEALPLLKDFVEKSKPEDPLRVLALESLGYAHEAKGELDLALASYERMNSENKTEFLPGMGLYHRARVLVLQGKKKDAAVAFAEVAVVAPTSAAAHLAAERSAELAKEGIVAPPAIPPAPATASDAGSPP